jgi:uncharacterized protein YxeA
MPEYIYSIILVVIIIVIGIYTAKKRRDDQWSGVLEKKKQNYSDENSIDTYTLIFRTEEGKKKKVTINSLNDFNNWNIGDKAEKRKGEYFPNRV